MAGAARHASAPLSTPSERPPQSDSRKKARVPRGNRASLRLPSRAARSRIGRTVCEVGDVARNGRAALGNGHHPGTPGGARWAGFCGR
eukprot:3491461-Prymnesium_polylepis.2